MMKQIQKSACALAVLAATAMPAMADSVEVKVIGTITPASCTPTLTGGGVIDYGYIRAQSLSATDYTVLDEKELDFTITCDAPAKVAVTAINGRPGTVAGATEGVSGVATAPAGVDLFGTASYEVVGLGKAGAANIGGYGVRLVNGMSQADGVNVDSIRSTNFQAWGANVTGSLNFAPGQIYITWGATGTLVPIAFTTLTGKLGVQAYLNKASELDLTSAITLDGLTTIELIYL